MTIQEQIDVPAPLLSRFDLVYIMRDIPDPVTDEDIASHMLSSRRIGGMLNAGEKIDENARNVIDAPVKQETFTRYIAYAKANISPVITEEAERKLLSFFKSLRGASNIDGKIHISFRYLHGLARLAEASAKMHLREEAGVQDAQVAIEVMSDALKTFAGDGGLPSMDDVEVIPAASQSDKRKAIFHAFNELGGEATPAEIATAAGVSMPQVSKYLGRMAQSGDVLRVGEKYRVV